MIDLSRYDLSDWVPIAYAERGRGWHFVPVDGAPFTRDVALQLSERGRLLQCLDYNRAPGHVAVVVLDPRQWRQKRGMQWAA